LLIILSAHYIVISKIEKTTLIFLNTSRAFDVLIIPSGKPNSVG